MDSLKFCLSLYGHKLPVLCMDISSDGDLIITGSADKNLRIWGLDFGDCHKSIFAHDDRLLPHSYNEICFERIPSFVNFDVLCYGVVDMQCYGCAVCSEYSLCF